MRHTCQGLDVVHDGRLAEGAFDGWVRRLDARPGAFAFEALNQAGLFPANVSARPAVEVNVEVKTLLSQDVFTEQLGVVKLIDRLLQDAVALAVFITKIEVRRGRAGGIASDDDAFQDLVRIFFLKNTIIKRS